MTGPDRMHWNPGSWWGCQLGGSSWILIAGLLSFRSNQATAITVLVFFAIVNLVGVALWRQKHRLSPYVAVQILLPVLGAAGLATVFELERAGIYEAIQIGGKISASSTYVLISAAVIVLMAVFYKLQRGPSCAAELKEKLKREIL